MSMKEVERLPLSFRKGYQRRLFLFEQTKTEVTNIIQRHLRMVGDKYLARVRLVEARIKSFESLTAKIIRKKLSVLEVWERIEDIVAFRIVCKNIEDVYRVKNIILSDKRLRPKGDIRDRIVEPDFSGYRAIQFNIKYDLKISDNAKTIPVICEIQIKTMLQDSWASLVHRDIYKEGAHLPKEIMTLSKRLSELLAIADNIAQDIRDQVSSPAIISLADKRGRKGEANRFTLGFIFKSKNNKDIPEYLVGQAINKCSEYELYRLDGLDGILSDREFIELLNAEHEKFFPGDISEEDIFLFAITAAAKGKEVAIKEAVKQFQQEYDEVVQIAKREEYPLPESLEELIEELSPKTKDDLIEQPLLVGQLARRFGVISECIICGTAIIDIEHLVEEIFVHYEKDDQKLQDNLTKILTNSGVETGGFENASLCAYHDEITGKQD